MKRVKIHILDNKHKWVRGLVFAAIFMAIPAFAEYGFVKIMPASYWFEYISIEPETQYASAGEQINFVSTLHVKQPVSMEWNDVMRCERADGTKYFWRSYDSANANVNTLGISSSTWNYPYALPDESGGSCWLESTITSRFFLGVEKQQFIKSHKVFMK